jgi:hypothetical protein
LKAFIGSWAGEMIFEPYGRNPKVYYTFYDDGTAEELVYQEGLPPRRNVWQYRVSGERLGLLKLEGTAWAAPSSGISRPYILSEDKRSMRRPREKVGLVNLFTEIILRHSVIPSAIQRIPHKVF